MTYLINYDNCREGHSCRFDRMSVEILRRRIVYRGLAWLGVAWHVLHQKQSSQEFYFSLFWTFSKLFCLLWFVFSRVSFCCILELQKWKMCKLWMRFPKSASEVQNCVQYWLRLIRPRNLRANSIISNFKRDILLI